MHLALKKILILDYKIDLYDGTIVFFRRFLYSKKNNLTDHLADG